MKNPKDLVVPVLNFVVVLPHYPNVPVIVFSQSDSMRKYNQNYEAFVEYYIDYIILVL